MLRFLWEIQRFLIKLPKRYSPGLTRFLTTHVCQLCFMHTRSESTVSRRIIHMYIVCACIYTNTYSWECALCTIVYQSRMCSMNSTVRWQKRWLHVLLCFFNECELLWKIFSGSMKLSRRSQNTRKTRVNTGSPEIVMSALPNKFLIGKTRKTGRSFTYSYFSCIWI